MSKDQHKIALKNRWKEQEAQKLIASIPVAHQDLRDLFTFVSFFDWDQKSYQDNRYVRAIVKDWPENQNLVGKHALIETQYVSYQKA